MVAISRRQTRHISLAVILFVVVLVIYDGIIQFQLKQEFIYYKKYFKHKSSDMLNVYDPLNIKQIPAQTIDNLYNYAIANAEKSGKAIDWKKYAYVNYATNINYLCNTLMLFQNLITFGTKADLLLLLSSSLVDTQYEKYHEVQSMCKKLSQIAPDRVVIKTVDSLIKPGDFTSYSESLTKLLVFKQNEYERVIYMDSDSVVNDNMDELFFLPEHITFAAPISYWLFSEDDLKEAAKDISKEKRSTIDPSYLNDLKSRISASQSIYNILPNLPHSIYSNSKSVIEDVIKYSSLKSKLFGSLFKSKKNGVIFASNIMVIKPSNIYYMIEKSVLPHALVSETEYDMDVINERIFNLQQIIHDQFLSFREHKTRFIPKILVLPYSRYNILSGSLLREQLHPHLKNDMLGYKVNDITGKESQPDLKTIASKAKYVHFSDYPMGKPWTFGSADDIKCSLDGVAVNQENKQELCKLWSNVYEKYFEDKQICNI
ncbi:HBL200Wp [Eremothecium sinecaudum]|uniref:HBL200Wp n=1 Tax=Eremothecium sinecaudum TaxID=45286 RepID=A0A109UWN6_9SACH|nr:HBL200Wp [Eremothecium sinecaudum]AMD18702.1 HBL200Wp [Eremothecium sinecaudum]